jgi:fermentation-respiration switch protein FrsA (DUF1100 family)
MRAARNLLDQLFVFHPLPWVDRDWRKLSGLPLEDVWFPSTDGTRLFGWILDAGPRSPMLLWCHGNAGNIIHRLENLVELYRLGFSVLLFDYRGYGRSDGKPSELGLYRDAQGAYLFVTEQRAVPRQRLVVFGRSLGSIVAADLVSRRPAAGLILESTFPSVAAVARLTYFGAAGYWLLGAKFNLLERLSFISAPILLIHGDRDSIIPLALGKIVFDAAPQPKEFYLVPGADHNDLYRIGGPAYFQRLKQFVGKVVRMT